MCTRKPIANFDSQGARSFYIDWNLRPRVGRVLARNRSTASIRNDAVKTMGHASLSRHTHQTRARVMDAEVAEWRKPQGKGSHNDGYAQWASKRVSRN
jgi:hypothetical protein